MASPGSIAYPDRFYAAAAYAGFGAASPSAAVSRFQNDVALLLYGLHQQVTHAPAPIQALPPRGVSLCVRCWLPESGVGDAGFFFLHFQATAGPCNVPKPRAWSPVEQSKWTRLVIPRLHPIPVVPTF
jgi:hypothetical protein